MRRPVALPSEASDNKVAAFLGSVRQPLLLAAGAIAAGVAGAVAYRTIVSGARRKTIQSAVDGGTANGEQLRQALDNLSNSCDSTADCLSQAIQLRTISFEYPDGRAASLLHLDEPEQQAQAAGGSSTHGKERKGNGGCACNCHAVQEAITGEKGAAAAVPDAVSSPSVKSLLQSRAALQSMHGLLAARFPRMHDPSGPITRHIVNGLSLVYIWKGAVPAGSGPMPPGFGLAAHMDVVPVPDAAGWTHPPFAGTRAADPVTGQDCVWGRGAIDDKHSVIALCAAVESLLTVGHTPAVPYICLCLGHDEELGGDDGAQVIAEQLPRLLATTLGVEQTQIPSPPLSFLLDEGLFLLSDFVPAHAGPVAVVCVGEKGHVNVELAVEAPAGHSSVPGPTTTIGVLSRAITRIESHLFPLHMEPAARLLSALLPGLPWTHRALLANLWLTAPLVKRAMAATPASAAMLRTSTAVTLINGGLKSNVLPPRASAVVNHRVHPHETVASVVERDRRAIADERVQLRPFEVLEPAPVSDSSPSALGWSSIAASLARVFGPGVVPAPGLMLGNTDTRHYWATAKDIYRHCPTELSMEGTRMFHGRDERLSVANLTRIAQFYASVVVEAGARAQGGQ